MKISRLAGLALVAVLAISLFAVSSAVAAPEFKPSTKGTSVVTSGDGTSVLSTPSAGVTVTCQSSSSAGEVSSATLIGNVHVHFLGCEGINNGATCSVKSPSAPLENLIITNTLHGVLGLILPVPTPPASDVALVLLASTGSQFVTLQGSCIETTKVTGQVAGLVSPVGTSTTKGSLKFTPSSPGNQEILDVDLSGGGLIAPILTAFGATSTEETTQLVTFGAAIEVT